MKITLHKSVSIKIIIVIIFTLLMPVLGYTVFQITRKDKDEELIRAIYYRQLESILFSVNQHCWDIMQLWMRTLSSSVYSIEGFTSYRETLNIWQDFHKTNSSLKGFFLQRNDTKNILIWSPNFTNDESINYATISNVLENNKDKLFKMVQLADDGYLRPESFTISNITDQSYSLITFPIKLQNEFLPDSLQTTIGAFIIDHSLFINEIVARKLGELGDENFIFAVKSVKNNILYSNTSDEISNFEKQENLWILPDLHLLIKLRGTTLDQLAKSRTTTNILFLVGLNIFLFAGTIYLVNNVIKETKLAQMKTDFVANVSHELRTPLALIRMYAELLDMNLVTTDDKKKQYYKTIMQESARLSQLINNILDFSRIESRKKEYALEPAYLQDLIYNALETFQFHLEQKRIQLKLDFAEELPKINIDKESVKQAFINLLDNAIKFSDDKQNIEISLYQKDQNIVLSVKDSGVGIVESELTKIFDKFYRVENSLTHKTKGTGLGLSLVKYIMDYHQGYVTVKSKPGEGSTFSLVFPLS